MENVNKKGKLRGKKFVWFERMLRREGRKLCAVALCASMIIGNMAWPAAAANDTSGEYSFELSSESLFDAIQDAIAEGTVVDEELDLKGSAAEEYQSFLEAGSSLYEIEPVIDNEDSDRDKVLDLRAFVRLENDIELDSAYVMDGSEEITFLLVNSSDVYQQATISVDGRESETITVLPASAVAVDEEEAGPGVSGTANNSNTTVTGSGSGSGGSGGSGGSNTTTGAADSTQIDESAADDNNTADIVIENNEINNNEEEQDSVVEVQPEEGSDEEEQEPEKEDESAENRQDDADTNGTGTDEDVSDTQDGTGDVPEEDDKGDDPAGTSDLAADDNKNDDENIDGDTTNSGSEEDSDVMDEPEGSDVTDDSGSDPADEDGESGTDESGNDNTADDQNSESDEEADDEDGEAGSGETVASAISVHTAYLLAVSATPSDAEEATPSDANGLNGEAYETILLDGEAVVAYVTTAEELELDKIETILYTAELEDVMFSVEVPVGALPWGVELKASEYEKDSETYQSRYAETVDMIDELDEEEDHTEAIRLFNVGFYDTDGVEVEPTEKVNVTITYLEADADDVGQVVHFGEEGTEVFDVETDYDEDGNKNIAYELESFSDIVTVASSDDGISVAAISGDTEVAVDDTITLTGSSGSDHSWTVTNVTGRANITYNGATAYVTGESEGEVTITHLYRKNSGGNVLGSGGQGSNWVSETYTVTVTAASSTIRVYVYVSASGMSTEMLELLGIDEDTLDGNGFFPAGEITLDRSYLNGKDTTTGAALINSESDWKTVLEALSNMDTTTLIGIYAANQNNSVPNYLDQAEQDLNGYIGSGLSALFRWNMTTSYGFEDQTVKYHLDLRFSTKTITFITGENGIESGDAADGETVDSRTYITGSIIQEPRNLNIPDGYKFAGYYTDAAMTEEWDGIGTALNEDTIVYIKLVPLTNVTINYVVQQGIGTVTDPSNYNAEVQEGSEYFNPITGEVVGSTAEAGLGYEFEGWYSNEALTDKVSSDLHYTPIAPDDGWTEGYETTYYAKFVPVKTTVTVNKVWNDNNSSLRPASVTVELYADDKTMETTVSLTADNNWTYTFTNLNKYSYNDDGTAKAEVVYTVKENEVSGYASEVTTNTDGTITVTNTLNMATVTLTKVVAGNMGVQSEKFTFTVNYTDASGASRIATYTLTGETGSNTAGFDVKLGTDVTVVETSKDLENSEVQHTISATVNDAKATVSDNTVTFTVNGDSEIVVTNTYSNNPGTGISLDSAPYIGILFGVLLLSAVAFIRRRRRVL